MRTHGTESIGASFAAGLPPPPHSPIPFTRPMCVCLVTANETTGAFNPISAELFISVGDFDGFLNTLTQFLRLYSHALSAAKPVKVTLCVQIMVRLSPQRTSSAAPFVAHLSDRINHVIDFVPSTAGRCIDAAPNLMANTSTEIRI